MGVLLSKLEARDERNTRSERPTQKSRQQAPPFSAVASVPISSNKSSSSTNTSNSDTLSTPRKPTLSSEVGTYAIPPRLSSANNGNLLQSTAAPISESSCINNRPPSTPSLPPERSRYTPQSISAEEDSGISGYPSASSSSPNAGAFMQRSALSRKKVQKMDEGEQLKHVVFDHNDEQEYNRQLRQHYVFKQVFGNTCVTFEETPKMILDSASGAGFWSLDMAQECPDAKVISLDMSLAEGSPPRPNIVYKAGNIMSPPLSFAPNTFDFVYQRDVGTVLPLLYWQPLIADFYRILKPKGFVQLVEYDLAIPNYGPYTQAVNRSIGEAIRTTGYDPYFTSSLGTMLHLAGFTNVKRHVVQIPVGEWPEDEVGRQQGFLNRELLKALFRSLRPRLSERLGLKPDSYEESCAAMIREIEENNGSCEVKIFTAQKA